MLSSLATNSVRFRLDAWAAATIGHHQQHRYVARAAHVTVFNLCPHVRTIFLGTLSAEGPSKNYVTRNIGISDSLPPLFENVTLSHDPLPPCSIIMLRMLPFCEKPLWRRFNVCHTVSFLTLRV